MPKKTKPASAKTARTKRSTQGKSRPKAPSKTPDEGVPKRKIIEHTELVADDSPSFGDVDTIKAIDKHITKHLGPSTFVLHEILSEYVHIDVHVVKPTAKRPHWYLVTSGMSDRPMKVPKGAEELQFAELVIALPKWWKVSKKAFEDERWYWPVRVLKTLARMPHEFGTFLAFDHSAAIDLLPAAKASFTGVLMGIDTVIPEKFYVLKRRKKTILFMTPVPLFASELELLMSEGADAFFSVASLLPDHDCYDPSRPNAVPDDTIPAKTKKRVTAKK